MNRQGNKATNVLYVVFVLSSEYYGIDMRDTYRILPMESLTRVSKLPPFFKGTVNLRGTRVPVLDLRARLGLKINRQTTESRIVIVNTTGQDVGFIVDAVAGVLPILTSSIEPVTASDVRNNYLSGIAVLGSRQVLLLDLDKVFSVVDGHVPTVPANDKSIPVR